MVTDIRYARPDDEPALRGIWDVCFPDDAAYAGTYFRNIYAPDKTLCVTEDDAPVAMLLRLARTLELDVAALPVHYLYAVSTRPECRGRGYATDLLEQSLFEAHLAGAAALVLILQTPKVYKLYEGVDFAPVSLWREESYSGAVTNSGTNIDTSPAAGLRAANECDIPALTRLYNNRANPKIRRGDADWRAILGENEVYVGAERYAVTWDGRLRESSDGAPVRAAFNEATVIGCLRIVSVKNTLPLTGLSGVVAVEDEWCPWNQGCWKIADGRAVRTDDAPELTLTIRELASRLAGDAYFHLMHN